MNKFMELPIKKKVILTIIAVYGLAGLWDGHWLIAIGLAAVGYWYFNKPVQGNTKQNTVHYEESESDDSNHKVSPDAFNQMSSSGNTIWTDYEEHIHKH